MKKKNFDILTLKTKEYELASKEADNAVTMVSTAMNRLKAANQKMQSNMDYIKSYCDNMMALHAKLEHDRDHNEAVISNFSKLLCIEDNG
jgi:flagellar biosynthesis chaperone FliJ